MNPHMQPRRDRATEKDGYRIAKHDSLKVTHAARRLIRKSVSMQTLELCGAVTWESDDSPHGYQTTESMIDIAYAAGGRVLRLDTFNAVQMTKDKVSSGKYIYIPE